MNIKFIIEYDGSNYKGWQIQKNHQSIQEELKNAFAKILPKEEINIIGSGRTDSGVHAVGQVASLKLNNSLNLDSLFKSVNSIINNDIYIKSYSEVENKFHARHAAVSREYKYYLSNEYSVIKKNFLWFIEFDSLDKKQLMECAQIIIGEHDFSSFSASKQETKNKRCIIYESFWEESKNELIYTVKANRFLHHMVRFLVGTMIQTSKGKIKIHDFQQILNNTSKLSPLCAPARGLFLHEVLYV